MSGAPVGVNLLWLVPGRVGGSEESTLASLRALVALDPPDLDLRLFVLEPFSAAHPDLAAALDTDVLPMSGRSRAVRVVGEATWLARRTRGLPLVHHAGGTAPVRRATPYVLTLHDLQPLDVHRTEGRASHSPLKRAYLAATVPRSVRSARAVIVPSEFVRASVLAHTDAAPESVVVVHHGVARHPAPTPESVVRERYDLVGRLVLYPAITYPHKNHAVLVDAFARVAREQPDVLLVLSGRPGPRDGALRARIDDLGLTARVRWLGRIPAADLAGVYLAASVVAVPSRYEGFGLPAAEAMAYGVPVLAADATAIPEVVGDTGVLVAADDVSGWAEALADLLDDDPRRAALAAAGQARAATFSWAANAAAMASVYRSALD
jgi:alpha-1,3-rhamnosyl/mannosyltransferase